MTFLLFKRRKKTIFLPLALTLLSLLQFPLTTHGQTDSSTTTTPELFVCPPPFNRTIPYPKNQHIALSEFQKLLETESGSEFSLEVNETEAEIIWKESTEYEWCRAWEAEETQDKKYPFFFCDVGDGTGSVRQSRMLNELDSSGTTTSYVTVYNRQDYTCLIISALASIVAEIPSRSDNSLYIHPMTYAMKLMAKTLSENITEGNKTETVLDVLLCPGVDGSSTTNVTSDDVLDFIKARDYFHGNESVASQMFFWTMRDDSERTSYWETVFSRSLNSDNETVCDPYVSRLAFEFDIKDISNGVTNSLNQMTISFDALIDYLSTDIGFDNVEEMSLANDCVTALTIAIAMMPEACSLHHRPLISTANVNAQWLTQTGVENIRPFFDVGLNGTNQVVAISDTGIDINNCYFWDNTPAGRQFQPSQFKIDLNQRKVIQYDPYVNTLDYQYGHGTHVAGTVAGLRAPDGIETSPGMADGIAPAAKIAFIDLGTQSGGLKVPMSERLLSTGRPYAHFHSASWGSEYNGYGANARSFDAYMHDNDDFLIMVAAGNSGGGNVGYTVGDPATAKNILSVGASHSYGSDLARGMLGPAYLADFSSRGPTADGRTKPDVIAPGSYILSAGALPDERGECDPDKKPGAGGESAGVLSIRGTSMATPVTSGTAALVRQYFVEGYYPTGVKTPGDEIDDPSAPLIKAVIMNGAQYLKGVDNGGGKTTPVEPYDMNQNYGHISLVDSLYLAGSSNVNVRIWDRQNVNVRIWDRQNVNDRETNKHDEELTFNTTGGCTNDVFSATLVWNDPPAFPGCKECVLNDLDLYVIKNDDEEKYYPNGKDGRDGVNNAERVRIDGVSHGDNFTVIVNAYNLFTRSQDYALVVTGCFGGLGNLNTASNVYEDDNSGNKRNNILMGIFIPLGTLLFCAGIVAGVKKRREGRGGGDDGYYEEDEGEEQILEGGQLQSDDRT